MALSVIYPVGKKIKSSLRSIGWAGFVAGSLDALAAVLQYVLQTGKNPIRVFTFIASGFFGKDAFTGGLPMALWGLFFHYFIACSFAGFFFLIYPRLGWLTRHLLLGGLLYGLFIWVVMNGLVLPISQVPKQSFSFQHALISLLILMGAVGLPISLLVGTYFSRLSRTAQKASV